MKKKRGKSTRNALGSIQIRDNKEISKFTSNLDNTFLVSFPRTGSHWLRMLMELYFERPSLTRVFYFFDRDDYLTSHTHDMDLDVERSHVIYLYRNPVETIYSQLRYYDEDIDDIERIEYWSQIYAQHLGRWLLFENFTKKKTIIKYDRLKDDRYNEFRKVCDHFNTAFDPERFDRVAAKVSKEKVKDKTPHDSQVINLNQSYAEARAAFRSKYQERIFDTILRGREQLTEYFDG